MSRAMDSRNLRAGQGLTARADLQAKSLALGEGSRGLNYIILYEIRGVSRAFCFFFHQKSCCQSLDLCAFAVANCSLLLSFACLPLLRLLSSTTATAGSSKGCSI